MRWFGNYLANLGTRLLGLTNMIWFVLVTIVAGLFGLAGWHRARIKEGKPGVQNWHLLLTGIAGTWIFLSLTLGAAAYWIYQAQGAISTSETKADEGPLSWLQGFTSMDGGMNGFNVFALTFQGANISKEAIELKSACITSLIDGTRLDLEIVGSDASGESKLVPINRVQLIAPGAPLELKAKFGPAAPNEPGKVMGLDPAKFLEKWRQFAFDATDSKRSYHFEVNERAFMVFFKGKVGPRVTIKSDDVK
jgi:hypothetical protein